MDNAAQPSRPPLDQVMTTVADVQGWMTPGQASTLYDSAVNCPNGSQIVEIGSSERTRDCPINQVAPHTLATLDITGQSDQ